MNSISSSSSARTEESIGRQKNLLLQKMAKFFFLMTLDEEKASGLPPHRGTLDHHINLRKNPDGTEPSLPWGPLYNMPRDHLLEVRRQVTGGEGGRR